MARPKLISYSRRSSTRSCNNGGKVLVDDAIVVVSTSTSMSRPVEATTKSGLVLDDIVTLEGGVATTLLNAWQCGTAMRHTTSSEEAILVLLLGLIFVAVGRVSLLTVATALVLLSLFIMVISMMVLYIVWIYLT
jgi:hypothetical protein